jgi:hypothetical protein
MLAGQNFHLELPQAQPIPAPDALDLPIRQPASRCQAAGMLGAIYPRPCVAGDLRRIQQVVVMRMGNEDVIGMGQVLPQQPPIRLRAPKGQLIGWRAGQEWIDQQNLVSGAQFKPRHTQPAKEDGHRFSLPPTSLNTIPSPGYPCAG